MLPAKSSTHLNSLLYFDSIVNNNKLCIIIIAIYFHVHQLGPNEVHLLIGILFFS